MGRLQPFPIVGGAYTDDAKSWANQDTVNYLPVRSEREGTKTAAKLEQAPGLRPFLKLGDGPIRGGRDVEGKGFVVSGTSLYRIAGDGVAQAVGTIPGTGPVTITHNQVTGGNQVVIGNGISGYVYDTSDNTLVQITDDGFPGFASLDFLGQMVLGVEPQRRFWFHSDLVDATSYNTNNRYSAETSPDRLVGVIAANNDAVVFGERTIEPWTLAPTANQNFQLQRGGVVEMGCAAARTLCRLDNSIFFLNNFGQVVQLAGYSPRIVSTRAMEGAISRCDLSRAFAFTWEDKGHAVYYITFPDGQTWGWDAAHGEWHRRKSFGMDRWRLSCLFKLNGHWYGGDAFNGLLHRLTWRWAKEACDPVERIRRTGFVYQAAERFRVNRMQFELDAGGTETVPYHWPDAAVVVTGSLPALTLGQSVAYQYDVTPPADRPFGMTVSGLPDGLTLHIDGTVTGRSTQPGLADVQITVVDDCGEPLAFDDEASTSLAFAQDAKPFGFPYVLEQGEGASSLISSDGSVGGIWLSGEGVPAFTEVADSGGYLMAAYSPTLNVMLVSSASELIGTGSNLAYSADGAALVACSESGTETGATAIAWIPEQSRFVGLSNFDRYTTSTDGVNLVSAAISGTWSGLAPQHIRWIASLGKFVAWRFDLPGPETTALSTADTIAGPWTVQTLAADSYLWVEWAEDLSLAVVMSTSGSGYWTDDFETFTPLTLAADLTSLSGFVALFAPCWSPLYGLFIARVRALSSHEIAVSTDGKNWSLADSSGIAPGTGATATIPLWDADGERYVFVSSDDVIYSL